jgi:CheY-like chemotaxis protein
MTLLTSPQCVSARTRVLVIDDNEQDLKFWSLALKKSALYNSIFESRSVESGLEVCRENAVDCVLLDLDMPISGFHALFELVPDRNRPQIAVIILTRLNHPNLFEMAKHNGAQACLIKQATSPTSLHVTIQQAIDAVKCGLEGKQIR